MELSFDDMDDDRLEVDLGFSHGLPASVVALYRSRLQILRAARDESDLQAMQCLRLHPLEIASNSKYSIHLDEQYCLIVELHAHSRNVQIVEVRAIQNESHRGASP